MSRHQVTIEDFARCVHEQAAFLASQDGRELVGVVSVAQVRDHYEHGVSVDATALDLVSAGCHLMTDTLRVRNLAQKILWDEELSGQISDGFWENATPWDHWKPWCHATVVIDPDHVGRDFYARRQSYNFTSNDLLGVVGDRMLGYVQAVIPDYTMADMRRDLKDLKVIIKQFVSPELPVPPQSTVTGTHTVVARYRHPQGSTIMVYSDGTVVKTNPAGDQVSTSATAEKLAAGHGQWVAWPTYNDTPETTSARTFTFADFDTKAV